MALAALISAYQDSGEPGAPLRATLALAGRTLIERQARLAAAVGASPIVVLVERLPTELLAAIDRLRRDRLSVVVARSAEEAAEAVDPSDRLLVLADGFIGDEIHLARLAGESGSALLTVPDGSFDERFERINADSRWSGLGVVEGLFLRETASMLRDWDLQSTLLRRALQAGARLIPIRGEPADAELMVVDRHSDLVQVQRRILEGAATGRGEWVSRYLLAPLETAATGFLMPGQVTPARLGIAATVLTGLGALAFMRGILWLGLLLMLLATPLDGIGGRLARLRMQDSLEQSWWSHLLPALAGAALVALGYSLASVSGWGTILLAITIIFFLLAQRFEIEGRVVEGQIFLAERKGLTWIMVPFAAFDIWVAGLAVLFAYAAASFFWAQRHVHRVPIVPRRD